MSDIKQTKQEIDQFLIEKNIDFEVKEEKNDKGKNIYFYYVGQENFGIVGVAEGKFIGTVLNHNRIEYFKKEGFSEQEIEENHPIWANCKNVDEFIKRVTFRVKVG